MSFEDPEKQQKNIENLFIDYLVSKHAEKLSGTTIPDVKFEMQKYIHSHIKGVKEGLASHARNHSFHILSDPKFKPVRDDLNGFAERVHKYFYYGRPSQREFDEFIGLFEPDFQKKYREHLDKSLQASFRNIDYKALKRG
ncbi:MAG: hypothetical protein H7A23_05880 [Leptospiraceae bacterium]|nr:hypothetical protein [Leptospiraceae bacterium]MCP5494068.1 hypothetical protein [Leptospiraceae bacterium]